MPSVITKEMRDKAIVHYGHDKCQEGLRYLLDEVVGLPNAIIPLENAEECGYIPETGFVWIKQQKKRQVLNPRTGKLTTYSTEITAYAEPCKLTKITGVKFKEMVFWIPLVEVNVAKPGAEMVTFVATSNLGQATFPAKWWTEDEDMKNSIQQGRGTKTLLQRTKGLLKV